MVFWAFAWDALGWYNVRSFGHYALEATGISESVITLIDIEDFTALSQGDEVHGYPDDKGYKPRMYYVTDITDDQIALQDTEYSYAYIRDKDSIIIDYNESFVESNKNEIN